MLWEKKKIYICQKYQDARQQAPLAALTHISQNTAQRYIYLATRLYNPQVVAGPVLHYHHTLYLFNSAFHHPVSGLTFDLLVKSLQGNIQRLRMPADCCTDREADIFSNLATQNQ